MNTILIPVFQLVALLFSVILHEVAHGFAALQLGDTTAKDRGRLTLNPLKHLDPVGSVILPILLKVIGSPVMLGWAKPVPYNPNALYKDYRYGPLKVALAGPATNIFIGLVFGLGLRFGSAYLSATAVALLGYIVYLNLQLAVFNLLPIPPLDGSKLLGLFSPRYLAWVERSGLTGLLFVVLFIYLFSGVISFVSVVLFQLFAGGGAVNIFMRFFFGG
jgi:Zn-dependent protease